MIRALRRHRNRKDKYDAQGLQTIGVSMDDGLELRDFYKQFQVNSPVVMAMRRFGEPYGGVLGWAIAFPIGATAESTPSRLAQPSVRARKRSLGLVAGMFTDAQARYSSERWVGHLLCFHCGRLGV